MAQVLAERLGAGVTALFGVRPDATRASFAYSAGAALRAADGMDALPYEQERSQLRERCEGPALRFAWCEVLGDTAWVRTSSTGQTRVLATDTERQEGNNELFIFQREAGEWKIHRYLFSTNRVSTASH